jgi:hypothetical protein
VAAAGFPDSAAGGGTGVVVALEDRLSDVETVAEGAAAMIGAGPVCPSPAAGADPASFPAVFTGAESVAKELGDWRTL